MKLLSKYIFSALFLAASGGSATAQSMRANTYCNPLNLDYTYMIYNSSNNLSYRIGMVLAKTFPAVLRHIQAEKLDRLALDQETVILIQFLAPKRINIGRAPE